MQNSNRHGHGHVHIGPFPFDQHDMPQCKCLVYYCDKCPILFKTNHESNSNETNMLPSISFVSMEYYYAVL